MMCIPPLAEQSRIVTSVCVLALGNLPTAHCGECGQRSPPHWRGGFHQPIRLEPERAYSLPRLRGQWGGGGGQALHFPSKNLPFVVVGYAAVFDGGPWLEARRPLKHCSAEQSFGDSGGQAQDQRDIGGEIGQVLRHQRRCVCARINIRLDYESSYESSPVGSR